MPELMALKQAFVQSQRTIWQWNVGLLKNVLAHILRHKACT